MTATKTELKFYRAYQKSGDCRREPVVIDFHETDEDGNITTGTAGEIHPMFEPLLLRSMNSHAELLQLCKDSLDIMVNQFGFDEGADIVIDLRAAIAKAEAH